ncbi:MAG: hypothetical protein E7063_03420 [Spirochaetaceae bacterium]|nr:hypothetical protein [Spirochaetaceae bacterium]
MVVNYTANFNATAGQVFASGTDSIRYSGGMVARENTTFFATAVGVAYYTANFNATAARGHTCNRNFSRHSSRMSHI